MRRVARIERGISLIEVLIASAILSFAVASISQAIVAGQTQTYESLRQLRGISLVDALIEEIQVSPYADPEGVEAAGPDAGETGRESFDNADDYHGLSEAAGSVADADNRLRSYEADFSGMMQEEIDAANTEFTVDTDFDTATSGDRGTAVFPAAVWANR